MQLSRAVSGLMVSAPLLLMGTVAVTSRIDSVAWNTPEYGTLAHRDLMEYVPLVAASQKLHQAAQNGSKLSAGPVLQLWIDANRAKALKPIQPAAAMDEGSEGARWDITEAKNNLVLDAILQTERLESNGNILEAKRLLLAAIDVSNFAKYMSAPAVSATDQTQKRIVGACANFIKSAPPEDRDQILAALDRIEVKPDLLRRSTIKQSSFGSAPERMASRELVNRAYESSRSAIKSVYAVAPDRGALKRNPSQSARAFMLVLNEEVGLGRKIRQLKSEYEPIASQMASSDPGNP